MKKLIIKSKPNALVCGMLEDDGRILFLVKNNQGVERIQLPCYESQTSTNQIQELAKEFQRQTGIDGEVHEIVFQSKYNAGSRKRKFLVPVLVFKITAKNRTAKPSNEFSGFRWLSLDDAKTFSLDRKLEWLKH